LRCADPNADGSIADLYSSGNELAGVVGLYNYGARFGVWPYNASSDTGQGYIQISEAATNSLFNNSWHHVVITWTAAASSTVIYVDAVAQSIEQLNGYTTTPRIAGNLAIGCRATGGNGLSNVYSAGWTAWSRGLTPNEIRNLYDCGAAMFRHRAPLSYKPTIVTGHPTIKRFGGVPYAAVNRGVW